MNRAERQIRRELDIILADERKRQAEEKYQERFTDPDCIECKYKPRNANDYGRIRGCQYCRSE